AQAGSAETSCNPKMKDGADEALPPSRLAELHGRARRRDAARDRARYRDDRPLRRAAALARLSGDQPERRRSGAARWRFSPLGIERDHPVPGRREARQPVVAAGPAAASGYRALAILEPRALAAGAPA